MTRKDAHEFAQHVDDNDRITEEECNRELNRLLWSLAPTSLKSKVLQTLLSRAEAFRRADAPGHEVWYPHHLQVAAFAARVCP